MAFSITTQATVFAPDGLTLTDFYKIERQGKLTPAHAIYRE
jgi:hypothetical protein